MNKKLLLFVLPLLLVFVAACSSDDDPVVSFGEQDLSVLAGGSVVVELNITNSPGSVAVPFQLGGTAVENQDYTVSAKVFNFASGQGTAQVTIETTENYEEAKTIELTLGSLPAGVGMGKVNKVTVSVVAGTPFIYSFEKSSFVLNQTASIGFNLKQFVDGKISEYRVESTTTIPVEVVVGESTAIEGEHFEFDGGKQVTIETAKSVGAVKIKFLKLEAGKDLIVLKVADASAKYQAGQTEKAKITIWGPSAGRIAGTWVGKKETFYDYFDLNTAWIDDATKLPKNISNKDTLFINDGTLRPKLTGDLVNYFRETSLSWLYERQIVLQEAGFPFQKVNADFFQMGKANVAFSSTTTTEREAIIGFRVFNEEGTNKTLLEITLGDYEPTDFLQNTYDMSKDWGDIPVMDGYSLRYYFELVAE